MGSNTSLHDQLALSTREINQKARLMIDTSKRSIIKANIPKYKIGNVNILNPTPTISLSPPKQSTNPPIHPAKPPAPATETDFAAARFLLDLSNHITAAETLLTLYTFGPPTNADSVAIFNTTKSSEDTKMVNLYCHGTDLRLQKPQDQAQAYLRSLSPAGRKGLVLLPAGVRRDGRLFPEELHGKIGCRRCAAVRAAAFGYEGCGSETEEEKEAELAPESCIKQSSSGKGITSAARVAKAPRKRVRIAEAKVEGVEVAAARVGATVVGGKVARSRRIVKAPMRFGA